MSANLNDLSSNVQNLAKQYKGVIELGEFLASLGSLDNLATEAKARAEQARKDEAQATADRDAARAAYKADKDKRDAAAAKTAQDAQDAIDAANNSAAAIVLEAQRKADALIEEATKQRALLDADFASVQASLDARVIDLTRAQKTLDGVNAQIDTLRAKLG